MEVLDALLIQLKDVRERQASTKGLMNKMIEAVKKSDEYIVLQAMNDTENELIADLEKEIVDVAISEFAKSGNKSVHDKVKVKVFKVFRILEENTVVQWVKENLADAMVMDQSKVKKYAMEIGSVPGTEVAEEPRVQIASEL